MIKTLLTCIESKVESNRSLYGRFQLGPFQLGQGLTVANGLRRSMLSELTGIAIVAVEIKGAIHEYSTLKGIQESVFDILLNLKQIGIKGQLPLNSPQIGFLQESGPTVVRACDLKLPPSIQIVDPQQYIATISRDGSLKLKILIWQGKNNCIQPFSISFQKINVKGADPQKEEKVKSNLDELSVNKKTTDKQITKNLSFFLRDTFLYFDSLTEQFEINSLKNVEDKKNLTYASQEDGSHEKRRNLLFDSKKEKNPFFYFKLDPVFTPVNNVNFVVEVDDSLEEPKDRIILEIWTNGTIKPRDAIYGGAKALIRLFGSFQTILPTGNLLNLGNVFQKYSTEDKISNSFTLFNQPNQIKSLSFSQKYNFRSSYLYSLRLRTKETSISNVQKNSSNFISFFPQNRKEHSKNSNTTFLNKDLENPSFLQNENLKNKKAINGNQNFLSRHANKIMASSPSEKLSFGEAETKENTFLKDLNFKKKENRVLSNDLKFLDIENLDFSLRLFTLLKQANIHTLRDLVQYSREDLFSIKGLNSKFVNQIEKKLSKMGFFLLKY